MLLALVICALVGSALVVWTRYGHRGEGSSLSDIVAQLGAMLLVGSVGAAAVWYGLRPLFGAYGSTPVRMGALAGLGILTVVSGGRRLAALLFMWSTQRPLDLDRAGFAARSIVASALGYSAVGAGVGWAGTLLPSGLRLLLLPVFVAAAPFFQAVVRPWLVLLRAPTLSCASASPGIAGLEAWFAETCRARGLARVRLRVQPGRLRNAYVVGGFWGHWVVVGEALLEEMTEVELKAILAHELAHVVRRDVRHYLAAAGVAGTLYLLGLPGVFRLWQGGQVALGVVVAGVLGAVCFGAIPGWVSRRAEFAADRVAVDMLGDPESLAAGLRSLSRIKGFPTDREGLTHPSVDSRIRALGRAQA
ncbi:MAG TPA: M48 family metallopeptidase [Longimicrobiales bacterium]|nr:M48 family metallopeptidase [Longimicrobiales bacterium]